MPLLKRRNPLLPLGEYALYKTIYRADSDYEYTRLTLMTYHGVVLLLAGYQADEQHIVKQYQAIVDTLRLSIPLPPKA